MAYTSQFTIYGSFDPYHPVLNGTSGSLLNLLNACLITGYGSKSGVGWSKTGSVSSATGIAISDSGSFGIFVQPTGSNVTLFIEDNAPGIGGTRDAKVTGYDYVMNFTASSDNNGSNVNGFNPFPALGQGVVGTAVNSGLTLPIRKSTTIDSTERQWIMFADSSSLYLFVVTGDIANTYMGFVFGDIYSVKSGSADMSKCIIIGRTAERSTALFAAEDKVDQLSLVYTATPVHFMQRTYTGVGGSITVGKHGDGTKGSTATLLGITQYPNSIDNGLYLSPVWVHENATSTIRGRLRGFWHVLHPIANFSDGQTFTGTTGIFAGKTFMMVKPSSNSGIYCMETSATVETN